MSEPHNSPEQQNPPAQQTAVSLMDIRNKSLGGKSYCNNPKSCNSCRIIRSNIKEIYFFGQETTMEEIDSFEWK